MNIHYLSKPFQANKHKLYEKHNKAPCLFDVSSYLAEQTPSIKIKNNFDTKEEKNRQLFQRIFKTA